MDSDKRSQFPAAENPALGPRPCSPSLERVLAFRQLATAFLDSCNPKLDKHIVVLNCIVDYDGPIPERRLRQMAHAFFREAERAIEYDGERGNGDADPHIDWIHNWLKRDRDLSANDQAVQPRERK
jgi:hypothetical protein